MKTRFASVTGLLALFLAVPALSQDSSITRVDGGLWELSVPGSSRVPVRMCAPDPSLLAQVVHRDRQCTRVVIASEGKETTIHYTCTGSGFGRTNVQVVTPRSLRIATQGINNGAPFNRVYHARRVGSC